MGSMGGEDGVGGKTSCGGSRAGERRGLGGAGRSVVPAGETACKQAGTDGHVCKNGECDKTIAHANLLSS